MPLTSEQNHVVTATDGHIVVLAGPGSGKTHTIIEKILYLFSKDIIPAPYGLLAITFTNAAANEMRSRLRSKGFSQWNRIWVGTFHSFGLYLLTCYGSDVGVREDFNIVDMEVQKEFINESSPGHLNPKEIEARKSAIEGLKRKGIYPNMGDAQVENELRITYHKYQQFLNEHNLLDFGDLVALSVRLLKQSALAKRLFTNFFRYIIVDEFQDSDNQQLEMIHILAQGAIGSTIVADDDQSIYRFRGAIRENLLKIKELIKAEEIVLGANFRSDKVIVEAAKAVIGYEDSRTPKEIEAVSINSGYLYKCEFPNPTAEAEQVVKWIGELISQQQVKDLGEIAIITRAGYRAKCVLKEMNQAKIPCFDRSRIGFQDSWEATLGLAILNLACDLNSSDRLHRVVSAIEDGGLAFRLGDKDALDLALQIRDRLVASIPLNAIPENAKIILDIAKCEQMIHKVCWSDTEAKRLLKNLNKMIEVMTQQAQLLKLNLNDTLNRLAGYGAVQVMSAHGAKGREFDQVFLVGLEDDVLPGYRTHKNENDIAEERRIFYVALTRARKAAYLTSAEEWDNIEKEQSRFINHIPKEFFSPLPPLGIQKVS